MESLLRVEDLTKYYKIAKGFASHVDLRAVDGVSFDLGQGETLGMVGESGSGKSTIGRCVLGLEMPTDGKVYFKDDLILDNQHNRFADRQMRRHVQMVFQDPFGSLNPRMTALQMVREPLEIHGISSGSEANERVASLFQLVGLKREHMERYPHQLSGGQQQRVGLARALATNPELVVLDEPTSSVDVSVQAQLLRVFQDLQERLGLAYLFISHDISVVNAVASRLAVVYLGQILEIGPTQELIRAGRHPYTQALMSSVPIDEPGERKIRTILQGEIGSALAVPSGCRLSPRCTFAEARCGDELQSLRLVRDSHWTRCWKWESLVPDNELKGLSFGRPNDKSK